MKKIRRSNIVKRRRALIKKHIFLKELEEAVEELNLILAGKKVARDASEFIKELREMN